MLRYGRPDLSAVERFTARVRGTIDALAGARDVRIVPEPEGREDALSNSRVLVKLARANPALVAPAADMDRAARAMAREYFIPWETPLAEVAVYAGIGAARAIAARLRSGDFVTNTPETLARKARMGRGATPGVDTGQLAAALERATAELVE